VPLKSGVCLQLDKDCGRIVGNMAPASGPSKNPFDTSKNTGGSSGGSAAAVADGLLPFAEGTDGGGAIRIPSSCCNVYGYKASFGRVPCLIRPNAFGSDTPFIFEGPITRNVEDAALALDALSGYHPTASMRKPTLSRPPGDRLRAGRSPTAPISTCSRSMHALPTPSPRQYARSNKPVLTWKK
jgi:Asp-tRNA(Asn)/Glu-tRNA(Gln) amidotransferase A subunit family amidase